MIKWNRKMERYGSLDIPYYVYSKKGVCLHLTRSDSKMLGSDVGGKYDLWTLRFSCYSNGQEGVIASKSIRVQHTTDSNRYTSNLKSRAGKIAHKMVNVYNVRLSNFKDFVEKK